MRGLAFALIALVAACGGTTTSGETAGACSAPCGGNVVGTWKWLSYCGPSSYQVSLSSCTVPVTYERVQGSMTGTMDFRADGTYSITMAISATLRVTYPSACLGSLNCDQLSQLMQAQAATNPDAGVTWAPCTATAGACACTEELAVQSGTGTATYSTNGSVLTEVTSTGSSSQFDYCAQGNRLTMTPRSAGNGGLTIMKGVGNVLEKLP